MASPRILVVDDEPDVVTLIARALQADGFEVISAYDGIAALDLASSEKPDLVLLDLMMPMMSGYEVCQQLKADPQTKDIPIICVTSAHMPGALEKSVKHGAATLLTKPFIPAELIAQIRRHLKPAEPVE